MSGTTSMGRKFVRKKLVRRFRKLSPESAEYYRSKFDRVMEVLNAGAI